MNKFAYVADNGDGTYKNPILYTDYSDPDAIRVGDDFFMIASSFCNSPAIPVLHSKDLVNWKVISYAAEFVPEERYNKETAHGCGVWAPAIRYYKGEYIIFFPMPDEGIYVTRTTDPWGKWSDPECLYSVKGWIDPCPFWDDDGKAYMVFGVARSRIGYKSVLHMVEISPDSKKLIGEPVKVFDGNVENQETIEGPKLYKRNGYYYIFAPAGGVKQGYQVVLRSKNIFGPYEYKNVLVQGSTAINGPHQGAWVDTQTGEDWFLHFQDVYAAGRIIHLQPMEWEEDWPIMGKKIGDFVGEPVAVHKKPNVGGVFEICCPDSSDDFSGEKLGLQWQWNANYKKEWYDLNGNGITLNAVPKTNESISDVRNLLLQKWCAPEFVAVTKIDATRLEDGGCAGMVSLGVTYGAVAVKRKGNKLCICKIYGEQKFHNEKASAEDKEEIVGEISSNTVFFKNTVRRVPSTDYNTDGAYKFPIPAEVITLEYSEDGKNYTKVLEYNAKAGRWVGVKHGIFAYSETENNAGSVTAEYFDIEPITQ